MPKVGFHWSKKLVMIWSSCDGAKEFERNAWIAGGLNTFQDFSLSLDVSPHGYHSHPIILIPLILIISLSNIPDIIQLEWTCLVSPLSLEVLPHLHPRLHRKVCPCSTFQSAPTILMNPSIVCFSITFLSFKTQRNINPIWLLCWHI